MNTMSEYIFIYFLIKIHELLIIHIITIPTYVLSVFWGLSKILLIDRFPDSDNTDEKTYLYWKLNH